MKQGKSQKEFEISLKNKIEVLSVKIDSSIKNKLKKIQNKMVEA